MLLRLHAIEDNGRLRKDVRIAQICFALVGRNLRKTTYYDTD